MAQPSRPLTGPKFRYVNAANTDIRVTFEKFKRLGNIRAANQRLLERVQAVPQSRA